MGIKFDGLQRFPSCEALVDAVPERDLGLADLPAEEDVCAVALRGEVEQALVEILHLDASLVDLPNALDEAVRRPHHLVGRHTNLARRDVAAVAGDPRDELRLSPLRFDERSALFDHPFCDRSQLL
jgi:hypothetical protein